MSESLTHLLFTSETDYKTPWNASGKKKQYEGYFSTLGWMIAAFVGILIVTIIVMLWSRLRRKRPREGEVSFLFTYTFE